MRLIQLTASMGWRGHEQKIIYLYEAFKEYGYVEDQWIICPENSEVFKVATEKGMNVISFPYKSEYDFKFAKQLSAISKEKKADVIFVDPPRKGLDDQFIQSSIKSNPERIVYVSCNPATQARDLSLLDTAYKVEAVQPVDMFPHTHHVENVVLLIKR